MAKTSVKLRQKRRLKLVSQYAERRAALVAVMKDQNASLEDKDEARRKLHKLPRFHRWLK